MGKRKHVHAWTRTSSHTHGRVIRYRCTSCPATREETKVAPAAAIESAVAAVLAERELGFNLDPWQQAKAASAQFATKPAHPYYGSLVVADWAAEGEAAIAYAQHILGAIDIDDLIEEALEHSRGTAADFATALRRLAERKA